MKFPLRRSVVEFTMSPEDAKEVSIKLDKLRGVERLVMKIPVGNLEIYLTHSIQLHPSCSIRLDRLRKMTYEDGILKIEGIGKRWIFPYKANIQVKLPTATAQMLMGKINELREETNHKLFE